MISGLITTHLLGSAQTINIESIRLFFNDVLACCLLDIEPMDKMAYTEAFDILVKAILESLTKEAISSSEEAYYLFSHTINTCLENHKQIQIVAAKPKPTPKVNAEESPKKAENTKESIEPNKAAEPNIIPTTNINTEATTLNQIAMESNLKVESKQESPQKSDTNIDDHDIKGNAEIKKESTGEIKQTIAIEEIKNEQIDKIQENKTEEKKDQKVADTVPPKEEQKKETNANKERDDNLESDDDINSRHSEKIALNDIDKSNDIITNNNVEDAIPPSLTVENQLQKSINDYEKAKESLAVQGEESLITNQVIASLKETLDQVKSRQDINKQLIIEQSSTREKGLKEIFYFYTRQQMMLGNNPTFEEIINEIHTLNIGEFMKFSKDFKIELPLAGLRDLFKKNAHLSREMKWDNFILFLPKIAFQIHHNRLDKTRKAVKDATNQLNSIQKKLNSKQKAVEVDANSQEMSTLKAELLDANRVKTDAIDEQNKLESIEPKCIEEQFYIFLECDNPNLYRKKMSGISLPFHTKDKSYRIPWEASAQKYKYKSGRSASEIKESVQKLRKQREEIARLKEKEKEIKEKKNREIMRKIYEKQRKEREPLIPNDKNTYASSKRLPKETVEVRRSITIQEISKMTSKEIGVEIKQSDVINEIEEDDDIEVLKRFNVITKYKYYAATM